MLYKEEWAAVFQAEGDPIPGNSQTIGESVSGDMETFVAWWITFHTFKGLLRLW